MRRVVAAAIVVSLPAAVALLIAPEARAEAVQDKGRGDASAVFDEYFDALFSGKYEQALAEAQRLQPTKGRPKSAAGLDAMRAAALLGLKRDAEAKPLISKLYKEQPDSIIPYFALFAGGNLTKQFDIAADAFDQLIDRYPDWTRSLNPELAGYFLRNEPEGQDRRNEDRRIALAKLGYGAGTATGRYMAAQGVDC